MTQDDKYYVPSIEEFHVGFEYQERVFTPNDPEEKWANVTCTSFADLYDTKFGISYPEGYIQAGLLRVKKPDKEDIESLGWKEVGSSDVLASFVFPLEGKEVNGLFFTKEGDPIAYGYWQLNHDKDDDVFYIVDFDGQRAFKGTIKNKSELRKVMEMLGIKQEERWQIKD